MFEAAARLDSGKNKPGFIVFYEAEQQQQHLAKQAVVCVVWQLFHVVLSHPAERGREKFVKMETLL